MDSKPKTLKKKALKASIWTILGHLLSQCIRFGGNLILTRLLVPEMFGVMAVVNSIWAGICMLSDIGLSQNVIQSSRGEDPTYLNTVWTMQVFRGVLVSLAILTASAGIYYAGLFNLIPQTTIYADQELPFLLAALSAGTFFNGFNSIYLIQLNRKLIMGKLIFIDITSQLLGLLAIVYIAWREQTIYALVAGTIISAALKMLFSHLFIPGKCRFAWDKETIAHIKQFGKWVMLASLLTFLFNQGDRLILGALITPERLGVYTVAFFLANAVKDLLGKLLSSVFFPVLSDTVRNRPEHLTQVYYKIRHRIDAISMFSAGFLYTAGQGIIDLFYDDRYHDAGWMLQILSVSIAGSGFMLAGQCFLAHGRSGLVSLSVGLQTLALYTMLPLAFMRFGLTGGMWAIAATPFARIIVTSVLMKVNYFFHFWKEFLMLPLLFLGGLAGKAIYLI